MSASKILSGSASTTALSLIGVLSLFWTLALTLPRAVRAEGSLRVASASPGDRGQALSASASIRIQVVVEPRLQIRGVPGLDESGNRLPGSRLPGSSLALSSNRGRILIACDVPANCAARTIGERGQMEAIIEPPAGAWTIAQP